MATHLTTGKKGELIAKNWLQARGFSILHTNWRYSHYEIDIVASREGILHFVEVKTRRNDRFGMPEEAVSKKKMHRLLCAGEAFLEQHEEWKDVRYDILSIMLNGNQTEFFFVEDVYS